MIGIICFWDRNATPYLAKYEEILRKNSIEFEVIFWNRTGVISTVDNKNEIEIILKSPLSIYKKIFTFYKWRQKILMILKKKKYDNLIILSTYPAFLLSKYLLRYYKEKYIFDIRDYSLESYSFFKRRIMKLISNSKFTTISSKGYMRWLDPSPKIIINHNITYIDLNFQKETFFRKNEKINITFVGNVRLDRQTRAMLLNMKNSKRYNFGFVGRMLNECDLDILCEKESILNTYKRGAFIESDKPDIYVNVDIINAVYANESTNLRLADATPLPNRVYDAAIFKCPIVASKGTYLAELIEKYKIGLAINGFDTNIEKEFDSYINTFDKKLFIDGCNRFLKDVMVEENDFRELLNSTVLSWNNK